MANKAKQTANENSTEAAEKVLADLVAKRDSVAQARAADEAAMADVAFEAHTGDQRAEAKLETLKERVLRKDLELRSIDSAVQVAKEKVALAQAEEAKANEKRVALEIQRLTKELREAGKLADEGLAMFLDATNAMHHVVSRFSSLGLGNPSAVQFVSLGERAVRTVLMETVFRRAFEHLGPAERKSFGSFTAEWAAMLDKATAAKLEQTKQKEVAA
jgi:hypothetical protein